jgi:hypothetical protein
MEHYNRVLRRISVGSNSGHGRRGFRPTVGVGPARPTAGVGPAKPTASVGLAKPTAGLGQDPLPAWICWQLLKVFFFFFFLYFVFSHFDLLILLSF